MRGRRFIPAGRQRFQSRRVLMNDHSGAGIGGQQGLLYRIADRMASARTFGVQRQMQLDEGRKPRHAGLEIMHIRDRRMVSRDAQDAGAFFIGNSRSIS